MEGLEASEGDSLVVQHGSVWSMGILDMLPPVYVCTRVRVCACACQDLRGQSGLSSWASAPYYARRGPLERAGRFGSDSPFPVLKDRIYCDNSFRGPASALKRGVVAPLSTTGVIHLSPPRRATPRQAARRVTLQVKRM